MVRACHKDTCPTGIATQRPNLRAKFAGTPEGVAAVPAASSPRRSGRSWPSLGLRSLDEAIGRVELLRQKRHRRPAGRLARPVAPAGAAGRPGRRPRRFVAGVAIQRPRSRARPPPGRRRLLRPVGGPRTSRSTTRSPTPTARSARRSAAPSGSSGATALPPGPVTARFTGAAGQSFGAFLADGVTLELTGEANDYVGKGMGGGRIVIRPAGRRRRRPGPGRQHPALRRHRRPAVRRRAGGGALLRAQQRRDGGGRGHRRPRLRVHDRRHASSILGPVGYNLGAGMTGGEAYVYDPDGRLGDRLNPPAGRGRPAQRRPGGRAALPGRAPPGVHRLRRWPPPCSPTGTPPSATSGGWRRSTRWPASSGPTKACSARPPSGRPRGSGGSRSSSSSRAARGGRPS